MSHNHTVVNCTVPMDLSVEPHLVNHAEYPQAVAHNGTMCSPPLASPSPSLASSSGSQVQAPVPGSNPSMSRQQSISQQLNYSQAGGPMPAFQPFFFTSTFPVNVQELVLKVRIQNPNTRENDFIEDKDVARLQDFQELEVVLEKSEGLSLFSGGSLTDRPCYNMKASRLTY
ncbi:hypothetical protein F7725_003573 [Dissostichus mawsoni]|uniref:Uncharacterized protein n=1 Tax=Dissostichus mawsoni TaxID=36200 RepID=A0A7J5YAR4_DISMA|nr:hypothetical protein F7725_003573 [Dissostichus mawsoni]